ncbi:hypothetical protein ACHHYP_20299 [Achlya hypogyna]|uniref:Reverse transcriptase zinc-binding domain-containing protein n=1 Tax=Achlya hypogyna TaxID=1202772 RepID=A0A1V9YS76_ACHHY|nr:hypothetical protein ACHHYP_20299 [Achlya hypogyna]
MYDASGQRQVTQKGIEDALYAYYTNLYAAEVSPPDDALKTFLQPLTDRRLPEKLSRRLEAPLVASEFYAAIMNSAKGQALGPNVLPHEVLRMEPTKWALALEIVFNHQLGTSSTLKASIDLRLPANVLPRYGDFVYRVALRAVAVRSRLHFLSPAERTCHFCTDSVESYAHLLVECRYTVAIQR